MQRQFDREDFEAMSTAPVLSTPDDEILSRTLPTIISPSAVPPTTSDLLICYEIQRTAARLVDGGWKCIALQFPDTLLHDAPRVIELLQLELAKIPVELGTILDEERPGLETSMNEISLSRASRSKSAARRLYILGDTSYGACCVDEIAAEHISAEVVVHYGRACLSPTARLPVIHIFTIQPLDHDALVQAFTRTYQDKETKIILMADVMFQSHIPILRARLQDEELYTNIYAPEIIHDPSSPIPNRVLPLELKEDTESLKKYVIFHISVPPIALLLTLSSRVGDVTIFPTDATSSPESTTIQASTSTLLRRRYGLLTSLSAVPIFGILINTLSVSSYASAAANITAKLKAAGKKSYTFVVGKINAAKIANFAEVGGWVVVGCWESSLVEGDGFWKPVITPFELDLVLKGDKGRVWTGEWNGGFGSWLADDTGGRNQDGIVDDVEEDADGSDEESAPPEFDLRTGRYVSNSRPLYAATKQSRIKDRSSTSLIKRSKGDVTRIGNEASPGAEFLRNQRTWRGLGSDIQIEYDDDSQQTGTLIEEGRSGIARGYTHET